MKKARVFSPRHRRETVGKTMTGRESIDRLYDGPWKIYSVKFLNINSMCYSCGKRATVTDHLIPHLGSLKLFWKTDNLIPLCKKCHDTVTALFDRRYRAGNSIDNKIKWMNYNRAQNDLSFRVKVVPLGDDISMKVKDKFGI